jgi:hypothetical protein
MPHNSGAESPDPQDLHVFENDMDLARVPTDDFKTDILVREIHQLEVTIRNILQGATQTLGPAFVVAVFAVGVTDGLSRDVTLTILPALFALTVVYHLNTSAEAAELRDRLSVRTNRALGTRTFATRLVSDFRRGSRGTIGLLILAVFSLHR